MINMNTITPQGNPPKYLLGTWPAIRGPLRSSVKRSLPDGWAITVSDLADPGPLASNGVLDVDDPNGDPHWCAALGMIDNQAVLIVQVHDALTDQSSHALQVFIRGVNEYFPDAQARMILKDRTFNMSIVEMLNTITDN
jgi:hypothetical protein